MASEQSILELVGVSKHFGGVRALTDVDFDLRAGEVHGLVGENGAGKSTTMKIIAGVLGTFEGTMKLDGEEVRFRSPRDALARGIGMVHQELSIVPELTVAENIFLGVQPVTAGFVDWRRMRREAAEQLRKLGIEIDPSALAGSLPLGLQQMVEIARVLFSGARIIILDEPTSALSPPEVKRLFQTLGRLKAEGKSFIFISHFLDDVIEVSDRITVFRNSRRVATAAVGEIDKAWILERMIGRGHDEIVESYAGEIALATPHPEAAPVLTVHGLSLGRAFRDINFQVKAGEILGIYGFMGSGQIELAHSLAGKLKPDAGHVEIEGAAKRFRNTSAARKAGIAFVPESRQMMLFAEEPIYKNVSIASLRALSRLWLKPLRERAIANDLIRELRVRAPSSDTLLGALSGGNQQKVGLARWIAAPPKVLVLSEPTRGMDVGAKADVVRIVRDMRDKGLAVVVVSTEPETVLSLADRILIMRRGAISREFAEETVSKTRLLDAA